MSLYDDLELPGDASPNDVNEAYRRLAKRHHPDAGGDPEQFARISHAAEVLRDASRRAEYDRSGREDKAATDPDERARKLLAGQFSAVLGRYISGDPFGPVDLVDAVKRALCELQTRQKSERRKAGEARQRIAMALARLTWNGLGPDIAVALLNQQDAALARGLDEMAVMLADIDRALDLAGDYDWQGDAATYDDGSRFMAFIPRHDSDQSWIDNLLTGDGQ